MLQPPICLTIAGSDPTAGAGLQADLKTFSALGCFGMSILTCSTAQTHEKLYDVIPLPAEHVAMQLKSILCCYPIAAVKIGLLGSPEVLEAVYEVLKQEAACPIVVDPVLKASAGGMLSEDTLVDLYKEVLLPLATLATPNTHEQLALFCEGSHENISLETRFSILQQFADKYRTHILAKGGHEIHHDSDLIIDYLIQPSRTQLVQFAHSKISTKNDHGTGCTLASAISANLAHGLKIEEAVAKAESYLNHVLSSSKNFILPKDKETARNLPMNHFV
jgi:hydroxymethylpyrimidine/phosphomethylpyrimidine kinase